MKTAISQSQIEFYQQYGYLVVEDFLNDTELGIWREAVSSAMNDMYGQKIPGRTGKMEEDDGINKDAEYHNKVFDQMIILWQSSTSVEKLMLDEYIGRMAAQLAGADGIRIWHDQALIKWPWAIPTSWHLDTPFWSFTDRNALSIWVVLVVVSFENGCLFFIHGSQK